MRKQRPEALAAASIGIASRPTHLTDLASVLTPTLVITSDDLQSPPAAARRLAEGIPGARLEILEGVGHLTSMEAPERFNELLRTHLVDCGAMSASVQ